MDFHEYQVAASRTVRADLSDRELLSEACMGLAGEGGELVNHVRKHLFQGHPLDTAYLLEEIGDQLWFLAELATLADLNLNNVAAKNIDKLKRRYPEGFSAEASINRVDKNNQQG